MAIWCIWRRRNDKVWNNEEPVPSISILFRMVSGKELLEEGGSCYTSNLQPTTWKKPPKGKIKSNIDAAIFKQQQIFGAGICIREGHGRFLKAKTTWQHGQLPDPAEAEAWSLLQALIWLQNLNVQEVILKLIANQQLMLQKTEVLVYLNLMYLFIGVDSFFPIFITQR